MSAEGERAHPAAVAPERELDLLRWGGDLVYLLEELSVRLFALTMLLTIAGCGLSIVVGVLADGATRALLTSIFAATGLVVAGTGLAWPQATYRRLRCTTSRELAPAGLAMAMVLVNGPDSPSWWVALPLLWAVATVSSTVRTVTASVATALAYLAGTLLGGEPLIDHGNAVILTSAVALIANTLLGRLLVEAFASFVLRMHAQAPAAAPRPVHADVQPTPAAPGSSNPMRQAVRPQRDRTSRLTARQLEVASLTRDGLRRGEIAVCLGISPRQVERLLHDACERVGAANATELVAMLVTGALTLPLDGPPARGDEAAVDPSDGADRRAAAS
jgi:DNA-binding CsgD family transcriptional regulator